MTAALCAMTTTPAVTTPITNARSSGGSRCGSRRSAPKRPARSSCAPFRRENRPHDVIAEDLSVAKSAAHEAVALRAELGERAVSACVDVDRAGFQPVHADVRERRVEDRRGGADEEPRAPE